MLAAFIAVVVEVDCLDIIDATAAAIILATLAATSVFASAMTDSASISSKYKKMYKISSAIFYTCMIATIFLFYA